MYFYKFTYKILDVCILESLFESYNVQCFLSIAFRNQIVALVFDKKLSKKQWEKICLLVKKDYESIIRKKDYTTSHVNDGFGNTFKLPTFSCIQTVVSHFTKDRKKMVIFLKYFNI